MPRTETLEVTCPNCSRKTAYALARLKTEPHCTCPGCGGRFDARNDAFAGAILEAEQDIARSRAEIDSIIRETFET